MKFQKKPIVIEAIQWDNNLTTSRKIEEFCPDIIGPMCDPYRSYPKDPYWYFEIQTLEGTMRLDPGDWLIKGIKGEFYPCKNDIFEATYEKVTQETTPGESPLNSAKGLEPLHHHMSV